MLVVILVVIATFACSGFFSKTIDRLEKQSFEPDIWPADQDREEFIKWLYDESHNPLNYLDQWLIK